MTNLTNKGLTYLLIAVFSFLFSYLITTFKFFPYFGLSISLITFAVFSYKYKKNKDNYTKGYLFFTLTFSALLAIRSEPFLTFINFGSALFFGSLMLTSSESITNGIIGNLSLPISLFIKSFLTKSDYYLQYKNSKSVKTTNKESIIFGVSASVVILTIVLPLLASANPIFSKTLQNIVVYLNISNLLKSVSIEILTIWIIRLVFFIGFIFIIPKIITLIAKTTNFELPLKPESINYPLNIPKTILSMVLVFFFITQIQIYFATSETLAKLGISYSEHAREVFGQLTIVAGIIFILIYNDKAKGKLSNMLTLTLGIQAFFLTLMAYKSAFDYISVWGFTYKRLYGLLFATWISGILILFFKNYKPKELVEDFVKKSIALSGLLLIATNIINFDYLIYHYKKSATGQGIDYTYLSTLSADSLSFKDQFKMLTNSIEDRNQPYDNKNPYTLLYKIDGLKNKYNTLDLRTFNLFEYIQYLDIKDIDTEKVRTYLNFNFLPE